MIGFYVCEWLSIRVYLCVCAFELWRWRCKRYLLCESSPFATCAHHSNCYKTFTMPTQYNCGGARSTPPSHTHTQYIHDSCKVITVNASLISHFCFWHRAWLVFVNIVQHARATPAPATTINEQQAQQTKKKKRTHVRLHTHTQYEKYRLHLNYYFRYLRSPNII